MRPHAMPSSTGSLTDPIPGKHECKGLVCSRARLVGLEALARSEHSVKGTHPRGSDAVWQTSARGPESAIATRQTPQHKTPNPRFIIGRRRHGWLAAQTRITQGKLAQAAQRENRGL